MMRQIAIIVLGLVLPAVAQAQSVVTVTNADIEGDVVWTNDNVYLMDGYVYVEEGETLTIEAGTVIKAKADPTTGDQETALIVSRGGKIYAQGTPGSPIIFTSEDDDVTDPDDLGPSDRGLWGGVLILGRARINVGGGENAIEGLPPDDPRNFYGGTDDEDDSGIFRYVSIRHGGAIFGQDNEINGLTMGGVGRGTQIDHVEVFANQDDGFEWFGGTVDTKYLVAAFVGDDLFDYDEGFRGRGQFWFGIHATDAAGTGGEHDGGTDPETGEPYAMPVIYNATYIGAGSQALLTSNDYALTIDDNAGGKYYNSIFTEFAGAGVTIEDVAGSEVDSRQRLEQGDLVLRNNIWYGFGDINGVGLDAYSDVFQQEWVAAAFAAQNRLGVDPQLRSISREADGSLDPRPTAGSPALELEAAEAAPRDGFFEYAGFIGAFGETLWTTGWTFLGQGGFTSTAIERVDASVPTRFELLQNYPNPFNPSTTIEFRLDEAQPVRLAVFDVLGREVAVLVDDARAAGTYRVAFDAADLASGLYFYQLRTERQTLTRSMLLLK
ncbi:hypothetical protein AWN76_012875 [Rhodothermaceae bacterium RA]|nr:hypothetical protein AWN76_012875 [Rhodothermaceae bacterium RA]